MAIASLLAGGCISDRYVGSLGRDLSYSNRGYGFAVRLASEGLERRWTMIDPNSAGEVPPPLQPEVHDEPIDLDGDGVLRMGETTHYFTPTLRLVSKTATAAELSIDVIILGGNDKKADLDSLLIHAMRSLARTSSPAEMLLLHAETATISSSFPARIAEAKAPSSAGGRSFRVAVIDQDQFVGEENVTRRQIVRAVLSAPELTEVLREDHRRLLRALLLNRRGGTETTQERW